MLEEPASVASLCQMAPPVLLRGTAAIALASFFLISFHSILAFHPRGLPFPTALTTEYRTRTSSQWTSSGFSSWYQQSQNHRAPHPSSNFWNPYSAVRGRMRLRCVGMIQGYTFLELLFWSLFFGHQMFTDYG